MANNATFWRYKKIIVSGKIFVRSGTRESFLESSAEAIRQARKAHGCRDFVVAADPIEPDRVNVHEEWDSEEELLAFRDSGTNESLQSVVVSASVSRHVVSLSAPA